MIFVLGMPRVSSRTDVPGVAKKNVESSEINKWQNVYLSPSAAVEEKIFRKKQRQPHQGKDTGCGNGPSKTRIGNPFISALIGAHLATIFTTPFISALQIAVPSTTAVVKYHHLHFTSSGCVSDDFRPWDAMAVIKDRCSRGGKNV
ncbi:hypothetical protein CEXT_148771 [Caerostris extrusa]|uniref:Uncharacterized protein n=1 Tax=Caerostris extrusa TaxID=172846 RepID=A0AAV4R6D1_CAEEX|nr:hypothetical protein CEXT_148771 [Caerostris extrusa]